MIIIPGVELNAKIEKKMINGKLRNDFELTFLNCRAKSLYFIQVDSNVWWKPRIIKEDWDNSYGRSIGWLFAQIGFIKFIK